MQPTGNMLGVVGVTISMKSLPQTERLKIAKAAYRKLQRECRETICDDNDNDDVSSYVGTADGNHYMKPCNVNIKDSMLDVLISEFSVLRMPLQSLAVAMLVSSNPCRMVCLGKTNLCSFQLGQDSGRVALLIQLASAEKANQLLDDIGGHTRAISLSPTTASHQIDFPVKPMPPNKGLQPFQPFTRQAPPRQHSAPMVGPPQLPPRQANISCEPLEINQLTLHEPSKLPLSISKTIQTDIAGSTEPEYIASEELPRTALSTSQQQRNKVINTARSKQFPHFVMDEIRMKVSHPQNEYSAEPIKPRFNRKMSDSNITLPFEQMSSLAQRRPSLEPVSAEFQRVSTPTSVVASSEPVFSFLGDDIVEPPIPETVAIQGSHTKDNECSLNNEQNPYKSVIFKSSDSDTQHKELNLVQDKDGYLIMRGHNTLFKEKAKLPSSNENIPKVPSSNHDIPVASPTQNISKPPPPKRNMLKPPPPKPNMLKPPPPHQNIPKQPGKVPESIYACEYESLPPPPPPLDTDTRKRQSKIVTELYEEEKRYINELKELQSALAVPGINRDSLRVVQKLYEFHRLTFCPQLEKACIGSKRDVAKAFTDNCSNFNIYEEMLLMRSKYTNSGNVENFRDKFLLPLVQLQKYKIALSALQDRDHDDTDLIEEAKDVIHNTLLRADNYLLLDSIVGFPFTKDQCGSIVNKGVVKVKSKGLSSKKDYLVILTETHLIFAEKVLPNKNQYIGCLRMDNLYYEGHTQLSVTFKGILHPGNGKVAQFTLTAQNTEATMNWVKAIREIMIKLAQNSTGFHERSTLV